LGTRSGPSARLSPQRGGRTELSFLIGGGAPPAPTAK